MNSDFFDELERLLNYHFNDKQLLVMAMSHSSYVNERKINKCDCNERLEFLGDAVLELVSSDYIYKKYPEKPEGELSRIRAALVCEPALFECSEEIKLGRFVLLGKGEERDNGRLKPSVISDAFEALLGAVYLDGGYENASAIIHKFILSDKRFVELESVDSKSKLQEEVQKKDKDCVIEYAVTDVSGPEHNKQFEVTVYINKKVMGKGTGKNKKTAEKMAAADAIKKLSDEV